MKEKLTVDEVYDLIGHLGRRQLLCYIYLSMLEIFVALHMLLAIFTGIESFFHDTIRDIMSSCVLDCSLKMNESQSWTLDAGLNPQFSCYAKDGSSKNNPLVGQCIVNSVDSCRLAYDVQFHSFPVEWNLICDQQYKVPLVQSIWMAGVMVGGIMLSGLADRIGRSRSLLIGVLGVMIFQGFSAYAPTYESHVFLRFVGGIFLPLVGVVSFVWSQELVGRSKRAMCSILQGVWFSLGIALLAGLAASVDNWRTLTLIASFSGVVFLFFPCFIPESPRWLVTQGEGLKGKQSLEKVALANGTLNVLPIHWELVISGDDVEGVSSNGGFSGVWQMLGYPVLLISFMIQMYSWFVNSGIYYCLTMAFSEFDGNVYVSTTLGGIIEIPASILAALAIDRWGRRFSLCGFMLIAGIACLLVQMMTDSSAKFVLYLGLIGKWAISASFSIIFVHSGELFPTVARNQCFGLVTMSARFGGIVAPFFLILSATWHNLHFTVMGALAVSAGLLNLYLPETLNWPLPENIEDAVVLHTSQTQCWSSESRYNKLTDIEGGRKKRSKCLPNCCSPLLLEFSDFSKGCEYKN